MHRRFALSALLFCLLFLLPHPTAADIVNGTFEDGLSGWTILRADPGGSIDTYTFYPARADTVFGHPRGCCFLVCECHIVHVGTGISQTAQFGIAGSTGACRLEYDYRLIYDQGCYYSRGQGLLWTYLDGIRLKEVSASINTGWVHEVLSVPAGVHTLAFWGAGGFWYMHLDNVTIVPDPDVAVESVTWSRIKALEASSAE